MGNIYITFPSVLFFFSFWGGQQSFAQHPCDNDQWAPVIVYPSQDIVVTLDPCDQDPAIVLFEISVIDDCDGDHFPTAPGQPVLPGSEYTVTVFPESSGVTLTYLENDGFSGVFPPGNYQILIRAEDAAGNLREEDFFVVVNQDDPPSTNLSCNPSINVTLNVDCQRFITPDMVLEGDFGCAQESDFLLNIINDNDPSNGNILDGCGQFTYEVAYVGSRPLLNWEDCEGYINGQVSGSGNNLTLSSQAEVDAFSSACLCPRLLGNIVISGADITNLNSLSGVTLIGGNLIIANNPALTSLAGLSALAIVGGNLYIGENTALTSLAGLDAIATIGGILQIESNTTLTNLTGLNGLSFIGYLNITDNSLLSTCEIQSVCDYLSVSSNNATISGNAPGCATRQQVEAACNAPACPPGDITFSTQAEIDAFPANYPGCTQITGNVNISGPDITNLNGLSGVAAIGGDLDMQDNPVLASLTGLGSLSYIEGYFIIGTNPALGNLTGLSRLNSVGELFLIHSNGALMSLNGLDALASVEGLTVYNNDALTSLTGLNELVSVGHLAIQENDILANLDGLDRPISISGSLLIQNNSLLTNCAVQAICDYLSSPSGSFNIGGNNLSCNSPAEVLAACTGGCGSPLPIAIYGNDCFSGSTTRLAATPGYGYTYQWSTSETSWSIRVPSGTYCVTVTEAATGCKGITCITVCNKPTVAISPMYAATICSGECIALKALAGDHSRYQWANSGPASATWTVCPTASSTVYTVAATNDSGCSATKSVTIITRPCDNESGCGDIWNRTAPGSETDTFEVDPGNAIEDGAATGVEITPLFGGSILVRAYPNPASHELIVDYTEQANLVQSLSLYNLTGQKVQDVEVSIAGSTRLDVSMLPSGLYILNVNGTMAKRIALAR